MIKKIEKRFKHIKNDPKFQEKLQEMQPQKSIWGFLVVILLFFVPELINDLYHKEILLWITEFANNTPNQQMSDLLIWIAKKIFTGEISWLNLALGVGFLVWLFRGK
jgi:hypothetical protein